ncbi:hypothetical protein [Photobacterium sp. Hal280]|uniref:hypothetical protein n=1 Tax=Photobacterium sp. Hal280 TaxID=3035163 RepID=UPI00301C43A5
MQDNKKKVIILDDDVFPKYSDVSDCDFYKRISDEDSKEFLATVEYLERKKIEHLDVHDYEAIIDFIQSTKFIEIALCDDDYLRLFKDESQESLQQLICQIEQTSIVFRPFFKCFSDEKQFLVERKNRRPLNSNELIGYDVVIMDLMMNDDYDNNFPGLANYLGELYKDGNHPGIFLISSRDELEEQKKCFVKRRK